MMPEKNPNELYHRIEDEEKIPPCKMLTIAIVAGLAVIVGIYLYCVFHIPR
jgi:hypothetical protein